MQRADQTPLFPVSCRCLCSGTSECHRGEGEAGSYGKQEEALACRRRGSHSFIHHSFIRSRSEPGTLVLRRELAFARSSLVSLSSYYVPGIVPGGVRGIGGTDAHFNEAGFKETALQLADVRPTLFLAGKLVGKLN